MATRATYQFISSVTNLASHTPALGRTIQTYYVHWDNYPEGAAYHLLKAVEHENTRSGLAGQFFRAVDGAEFVGAEDHESPQNMGTDFRYTIIGQWPTAVIRVDRSVWNGDDKPSTWENVGRRQQQPLRGFIESHRQWLKDNGCDFDGFQEIPNRLGGRMVASRNMAERILHAEHGPISHLKAWQTNATLSTESGNWRSMVAQAQDIVTTFPELATPEINELLNFHRVPETATA